MDTVGFVVVFAGLALFFGVVERLFRAVPTRRTTWRTDLAWLLAGRLVDPVVKLGIGACCLVPILALGLPRERELLLEGHGPLSTLPVALQFVLVLLVSDGMSTLTHRLHHRWRPLWRVHAVHHSSRHLDWLSAVRVHPLNELAQRVPSAVVAITLGFDLRVVAAAAPFLTLWAITLHANVDWRFGWLRYVFATPAFHRWHHAAPPPGHPHGCNFAGLFPVFDLVLGTYWLPPEPATSFGVTDPDVPDGFLGQLLLRTK